MNNQSDPLMFIETATTIKSIHGQTVFDSRYQNKRPERINLEEIPQKDVLIVETPMKEIDSEVVLKLESVIDLYNMSKPVVCEIITTDKKYEGIPFFLDGENLLIKQNGFDVTINLYIIKEVLIIRL